jgi:hypothetical protein
VKQSINQEKLYLMKLLLKKKNRELAFSCQPEQEFPIDKGYLL